MGRVTISKDGQPVVLPFDEVTGKQLKEQLGIAPERIPTVVESGQTRAVGDNERVQLAPGTYISDAPRFTYGVAPSVAVRLQAEAAYIGQLYGTSAEFGYDENLGRWWLYVPEFHLPPGWRQATTPILVTVPSAYPSASPDGFFLSNELRNGHGRTPSHYFEARSAHNPLTEMGWAWFCIHPDGWRASYDVMEGDSIVKYLTLIHLAMSQVVGGGPPAY